MNEDLKQKLNAWEVDLDIPARFQANVWAEIAARESRWDRLLNWLVAEFHKPLPTVAFVTLALALGTGTAYFRAQDYNARNGKQMEALYMQTINPLAHAQNSRS